MANETENPHHDKTRMLRDHLHGRGITDPRILDAFGRVPREAFVPENLKDQAYADRPLPIGREQTISQPYVVAYTLQLLAPEPGDKVLDVGAGSGYQAALLGCLASEVHAVERHPDLAEKARGVLGRLGIGNVTVHVGDGSLGLEKFAPFDCIVSAAASPDVPQAWREQLAEGGRIVAPVGSRDHQQIVCLRKRARRWIREQRLGVRFVPLLGEQGWKIPQDPRPPSSR